MNDIYFIYIYICVALVAVRPPSAAYSLVKMSLPRCLCTVIHFLFYELYIVNCYIVWLTVIVNFDLDINN